MLILAPIAFCGIQVVNYLTRLELLQPYGWKGLMAWTNYFWSITLLLGITILTSMMAGLEHDAKAWTKLFALPVHPFAAFFSKFLLVTGCLALAVCFTFVGLIIVGQLFDLGKIDWALVVQQMFVPFVASMPIIVLQLWLSMIIQNQAVPITIGIIGAMISLFLAYSPSPLLQMFPWAYVPLSSPLYEGTEGIYWPLVGVFLGMVLLITGGLHFSKSERN